MTGHIQKRGPDTWLLMLELGRDVNGKRMRPSRTYHGKKRQAEGALRDWLHEVENGGLVVDHTLTLGDWLTRWLRDYAPLRCGPSTMKRYTGIVEKHFPKSFIGYPLIKVNAPLLQQLYGQWQQQGLSVGTIRQHHAVLSQAMNTALTVGVLNRNPLAGVVVPRLERETRKALTTDEVNTLIANADDLTLPIQLAVATGMRRGELLALRWEDVDLKRAVLTVNGTLLEDRTRGVTKTAAGRRSITLPASTVTLLKEHRRGQLKTKMSEKLWHQNDLVLCQSDGSPLSPNLLTAQFGRLCAKLGIEATFHSLRHYHATTLLEAGVHPKVVQERMGHASIKETLDRYSHVSQSLQAEAAVKLERALG